MGGEREEWMDTDSLLGSSGMEPALWSPTARAWRTSLSVEKFERLKPKERRYLVYAGSFQFKFVPLC